MEVKDSTDMARTQASPEIDRTCQIQSKITTLTITQGLTQPRIFTDPLKFNLRRGPTKV